MIHDIGVCVGGFFRCAYVGMGRVRVSFVRLF